MTDDPTAANPQSVGRLAAFRYRDFRLFWFSLFISNIGTWMQMTATNWLLYQLTNSPLQLGLNGVFRAIPAIALGLISGTFADRYDRKRLLLWTQVILGVLTLGLGILDQAGHIQAWHIYLFTFISSSVGSFDGPARQALFPSLVPRAVLPNAVALNSLLWKGAALLGPTFGGIAIAAMGTAGAFYANAVSFLAVVVALLFMRAPSPARERQRDFLAETKAGFSYIVSQPVILGLTVMEAFASVFGLDHAMLTILASDVFRVGAHGFGFLQSSRGVGAVIGSSLFIAMGNRSLWSRFRGLRSIAVISGGAGAARLRRRYRYHLGRCPRHDHANARSGKISWACYGCVSTEQSWAPPVGANRNRPGGALVGRARSDCHGRRDHHDHDPAHRLAHTGNSKIYLGST